MTGKVEKGIPAPTGTIGAANGKSADDLVAFRTLLFGLPNDKKTQQAFQDWLTHRGVEHLGAVVRNVQSAKNLERAKDEAAAGISAVEGFAKDADVTWIPHLGTLRELNQATIARVHDVWSAPDVKVTWSQDEALVYAFQLGRFGFSDVQIETWWGQAILEKSSKDKSDLGAARSHAIQTGRAVARLAKGESLEAKKVSETFGAFRDSAESAAFDSIVAIRKEAINWPSAHYRELAVQALAFNGPYNPLVPRGPDGRAALQLLLKLVGHFAGYPLGGTGR